MLCELHQGRATLIARQGCRGCPPSQFFFIRDSYSIPYKFPSNSLRARRKALAHLQPCTLRVLFGQQLDSLDVEIATLCADSCALSSAA